MVYDGDSPSTRPGNRCAETVWSVIVEIGAVAIRDHALATTDVAIVEVPAYAYLGHRLPPVQWAAGKTVAECPESRPGHAAAWFIS